MNDPLLKTSRWVYRGVWSVLVNWFRVPEQPPHLPTRQGEKLDVFAPSLDWLRYLKLNFWILFLLQKTMAIVLCIVLIIALPILGFLIGVPVLLFIALVGVVMYIALHLRFDTTRYVMSERSLRIRRGIWVIHETTITFENIQNVSVSQGPLQRYFGIADVVVQTAGGGGHGPGSEGQSASMSAHVGLIEGIANAQEVRDRILSHLMQSTSAGLGDERQALAPTATRPAFSRSHLEVLREIRDAVASLP